MRAQAVFAYSARIALGLALLGMIGCATHVQQLHEIRDDFYAGRLDAARQTLETRLAKNSRDAEALQLEHALVDLVSGRPREAEKTLRLARDRLDHLEQASLGEEAWSLLTDDNQRSYAGEDYEKVLIRALLALANLMHDGADAEAYSLQMIDKQHQIIQSAAEPDGSNPKLAYKQTPLGPYLRGVIREESHLHYDDALRSFQTVAAWAPAFRFAAQDVQRAASGKHSAPGHGVIYVFTLVGRGPYKEPTIEVPSTAALMIAGALLQTAGGQKLPPTLAPIQVPRVVRHNTSWETVHLAVNGVPAGHTETIVNIGDMAVEQHTAVRDYIVARAVARRVVKSGVVVAAKQAVEAQGNPLVNLLCDAGAVAWQATETADTRCWGLLPDTIQVQRLELPAGQHTLALQAGQPGFPTGARHETQVAVTDGKNTYVLAYFADGKLLGQISASRQN